MGGLHEAVAEIYERAGKPEWAAQERRAIKPRPAAECATRVAECDFLAGKFRESLAAGLQSPTSERPLLDDSRGEPSGRPKRSPGSRRCRLPSSSI